MDILVRLYVRHDSDLLDLHFNPNFSLASAMRDALIAYVREQPVCFQMPVPYKSHRAKRNASLHLYLHPEEDEDIIHFLLGMREGVRCAAIKNLVRGYMMYPNIYACMENTDKASEKAGRIYAKTNCEVTETGQPFLRGRGNKGKKKLPVDENAKKTRKKAIPEKDTDKDVPKESLINKESVTIEEQMALEESMADFMSDILS